MGVKPALYVSSARLVRVNIAVVLCVSVALEVFIFVGINNCILRGTEASMGTQI